MPFDKAARTAQLARCITHAGDTFSFLGQEFQANIRQLRPDDPRLQGSTDRLFEIVATTAELPVLKRGDSIQRAEKYHRIARIDANLESGTTTLILTA